MSSLGAKIGEELLKGVKQNAGSTYTLQKIGEALDVIDMALGATKDFTGNNSIIVTPQKDPVKNILQNIHIDFSHQGTSDTSLVNALNKVSTELKKVKPPVVNVNVPKTEAPVINLPDNTTLVEAIHANAFMGASIINQLVEMNLVQRTISDNLSLQNELMSAKIVSDYDLGTAMISAINNIGNELKIQRELQTELLVKNSDKIEQYVSAVATHFDFMNTGKLRDKTNFFGEASPEFLKDGDTVIIPREVEARKNHELAENLSYKNKTQIETVSGTKTTPREAEAKYHAEKHDETKDMNKTDFGSLLVDSDYTDPFKLLKGVFALNNDGTIPKHLVEDEIKKEETTEEVQNG